MHSFQKRASVQASRYILLFLFALPLLFGCWAWGWMGAVGVVISWCLAGYLDYKLAGGSFEIFRILITIVGSLCLFFGSHGAHNQFVVSLILVAIYSFCAYFWTQDPTETKGQVL